MRDLIMRELEHFKTAWYETSRMERTAIWVIILCFIAAVYYFWNMQVS